MIFLLDGSLITMALGIQMGKQAAADLFLLNIFRNLTGRKASTTVKSNGHLTRRVRETQESIRQFLSWKAAKSMCPLG